MCNTTRVDRMHYRQPSILSRLRDAWREFMRPRMPDVVFTREDLNTLSAPQIHAILSGARPFPSELTLNDRF